ncbi:MAG: dihydropteroate synthase [Caldilinea sp.]|nr:dihydropteroate synthase [Caldilinea sp.]MCB0147617.1 dihydropteroate synthase [Caldilineaceae bacterium]MCB9118028.1 dihydropteroate synthase [Caldilineaceae bacterium]MCB9122446.1 dihydropteroate synthase [Caldilineaceae bacterium]MCO5213651.1 dihydropteroate synthase [Caldilinea sp.]
MYIIGENIHIISPRVKEALAERDGAFFTDLARRQVAAGAQALDLNIGPRKKDGPEVMEWLLDCVCPGADGAAFSLDTTNLAAIEAGLKKLERGRAIINSTSAEPERLEKVPLVAAQYGAKLVALTMGSGMIPVKADERVEIALEKLIPRALEVGMPVEDLIIDPLVLTVSGCQEYCPECIEAVRTLKFAWDPAPTVSVGLSNVSNAVPREMRPLLNRVYMVMLMAAGVDMVIADPFDEDLKEAIRIVEERDASTPVGKLYLTLYDRTAEMGELEAADVDMRDPEQAEIFKTVQVLLNKVIYTDSYLRL